MKTDDWAPLPLRLALGGGLIWHGGIKLFAPGGHDNIAYLLGQLGVPWPEPVGWIVGIVEFGGGVGLVLGALMLLSAGLNALNVLGLLVLAAIGGGIPEPLPGGDPLPEYREAVMIFAVCVSLLLSGPGRLAVDRIVTAA